MTLENFNYRTSPLFLRNEFNSDNNYGIPTIPLMYFDENELDNLRLIAFNQLSGDKGKHSERIVHFFLYDYNFEKVWTKPNLYVDSLSKYKGILTPDFSMYLEMPYALQIYNTFRNRWCGAYFANKGLKVIPTVNWADEKSFDFCFKGIKKGSTVAVSTYMFHEHGNHADQKEIFMKGYNKMMEEIEPSKIICYSEPFDEMKGDIVYIDYDLNSWKYLDSSQKSSKKYIKCTNSLLTSTAKKSIITKVGYICKGGGSAFGGKWIPKKPSDERFYGKPNSTKDHHAGGKKGGYDVIDKYDEHGRAVYERHLTDHNREDLHSNPHDHEISWDNGHPKLSPPINYPDENIPEFKKYDLEVICMSKINNYNPDDYKFESLGEFKFCLSCGSTVGFEYNGVEYGLEGHNNSFDIWIYNKRDIANNLTLEQVLDYEIDGVKIRNLILTAEIIDRVL